MKFNVKKIAPDKWKHFLVGILLGAGLQYASHFFLQGYSSAIRFFVASVLLMGICYGFELFSKITGKGHYELWDAIAGVLGGVAGIILVVILAKM